MKLLTEVNFICVHCAASKTEMNVEKETLHRWHVLDNGWEDIGYHYFIKFNGSLIECRDRKYQGAHCTPINRNSIAICLEGGFGGVNNFHPKQLEKLRSVINALKIEFPNAALVGHSHFSEKPCPAFPVVEWYENKPEPIGFV